MPLVTEHRSEATQAPVSRQAAQDAAMREVLQHASDRQYRFVAPAPTTHGHRLQDQNATARDLRDVFGWNLPFSASVIGLGIVKAMQRAGILAAEAAGLRSLVRIASVDDTLFLHSAYLTADDDPVLVGPDTYRFVRFIRQSLHTLGLSKLARGALPDSRPLRVLDCGSGAGAGGLAAYRALSELRRPTDLVMNDDNPLARRFTAINAAFAGVPITLAGDDCMSATTGDFDLIVSNTPYRLNPSPQGLGGERSGCARIVDITRQAVSRLAPGGALLLHTGVAVEGGGRNRFLQELVPVLDSVRCDWSYAEIEPDVMREEVGCGGAERIAAVGLIARRPG